MVTPPPSESHLWLLIYNSQMCSSSLKCYFRHYRGIPSDIHARKEAHWQVYFQRGGNRLQHQLGNIILLSLPCLRLLLHTHAALQLLQVTELTQVTNYLFYLEYVLNPDCFCYQSDTRNCSAGATEEVGPWDAVGRKAVRFAGTTKEACLGSDGLFP